MIIRQFKEKAQISTWVLFPAKSEPPAGQDFKKNAKHKICLSVRYIFISENEKLTLHASLKQYVNEGNNITSSCTIACTDNGKFSATNKRK